MATTFEDISKANGTIHTTPIKGKQYAEVNQRIKAFRMVHPNGFINTEMVSNENGVCIFRAVVGTEDGKVLGTGTAYEKESSNQINKTSYIENCETSSVGRALGMCGFGIDVSVASYEEVQNAIEQQNEVSPMEEAKKRTEMIKLISELNLSVPAICKKFEVKKLNDMNYKQACDCIAWIERKRGDKNDKE